MQKDSGDRDHNEEDQYFYGKSKNRGVVPPEQSLLKYNLEFSEAEPTEDLRATLAKFYAQRTLTKEAVLPQDCANAIVWLASDQSAKITGQVIPVDGGLPEAFLR
jgi:NAD(P)-dependent dehydrogenase (short-subunit alcohol dehydrogenase family)